VIVLIVVVLVVVAVAAALAAYRRSDKTQRDETHSQYTSRTEGDALERRFAEDQRRRDGSPPTHDEV
jgi:flagellar basal body-associated protein FliL